MTDVTVDESGYTVSVSTPSVGAVSVTESVEPDAPVVVTGQTFDISVVERPTGQLAIDGLDPGEYIKSLTAIDSKIAVNVDGSGNATVRHQNPSIATTAYAGYPTVIRTDETGHIVAITVESDKATYRTEIGLGSAATREAAEFLGNDNTSLYGRQFASQTDATSARSFLSLGTAASFDANDFANTTHYHDAADVTSGVFNLARIPDIGADKITGEEFSIDLNPSDDGVYSIGTEDLRWLDIHGDLDGAVTFRAKNDSGVTLYPGDVVYINGVHGETPTVGLADASDPSKMPAFGIIRDQSNNNAETHVVTLGSVHGVPLDPAQYSVGQNVYVSTTAGEFSATPPSGESNLIQNIGYVARVHASAGVLKVGGAGRTNAVPNLNQDKIFIGNASNNAVATDISSINLSGFSVDIGVADMVDVTAPAPFEDDVLIYRSGSWTSLQHRTSRMADWSTTTPLSGQIVKYNGTQWEPQNEVPATDWKLTPDSGTVIRLFEDFMGSDNRSLKSHAPFFSLGTSSAYWDDAYDYTHDSTGVVRANTTVSAYARAVIMGPEVYTTSPSLGDEWTVEMRVRPEFNASAVNAWIGLGSFSPKTDLNTQTTEQVRGYGDTAKSGFYWSASSTYWYTSTYDTEGTNGNTTDTSTGVSMSNSTWVRIALHCKREELFSIPVWRTDCYVNGVKVGSSMYNLSGTRSPTWSFIHYNGGDAFSNSCLIDWIVFQYRRPTAVTYLDIEDLT